MHQHATHMTFTASESWVILSPIEESIRRKIEAVGTPLKDWDIQINYGIKTGCNDAFIVSTAKRDEILASCQTEEERQRIEALIRPILRGKDIKRYGYNWAGLWLIATFPALHYDIDEYPAIRDYLLSFGKERLEQSGKSYLINGEQIKARKKTNNKWFETQDSISYWKDFEKPKIVYGEIQTDNEKEGYSFPAFSFDPNNAIVLNSGYIMTSNSVDMRFILSVLNSKLGRFLVKLYVTQLQKQQFRMLAQYVSLFPIPILPKEKMDDITRLIEAYSVHPPKDVEDRVDQTIYSWYKLNAEEQAFIQAFI